MTKTVYRVLETLLWGFALFMVIPAVPSDAGQRYSATPALVIGGAAFCAHIGIKIWQKEETVFFGAIKTMIYALFVVGVNMRVFL